MKSLFSNPFKNPPRNPADKESIAEYNDLVAWLRENSACYDDQVVATNADKMIRLAEWAISTSRAASVWPFTFGLACCAIEMMATVASRFDMDRYGAGIFRASPRQADLMIVSGTVTYKMAECIERLWEQMPEPKWAIAMGACATNAGPYDPHGYHVVKGVDLIIPIHQYTPGCPPRPEALIGSLINLRDMIKSGRDREVRLEWERSRHSESFLEGASGAPGESAISEVGAEDAGDVAAENTDTLSSEQEAVKRKEAAGD